MHHWTRNILVGTTLVSCLLTIAYGVYYTQQDKNSKIAGYQAPHRGFPVHHLSSDLTPGTKNAELESDIKTVQADVDQFQLLNRRTLSSREGLRVLLQRLTRISAEDKAFIENQYSQDPSPVVDRYWALIVAYLNVALIDRQTTLSDKFLPRYQAVPQAAGQSRTIKALYGRVRENLNTMRNLNAASYFDLVENVREIAAVEADQEEVLQLAQENMEAMQSIIPLIQAFELP